MKKILSAIVALTLLSSTASAAMINDPQEVQDLISKAREQLNGYYEVIDEYTGREQLFLDTDIAVKLWEKEEFVDSVVSKSKTKAKAKNEGGSITADFKAEFDMTHMREVFEAYERVADIAEPGSDKANEVINAPVTGKIEYNIVYDAKMTFTDELLEYHMTAGLMNGFNEEAKRIFVDTSRELIEGKAVLADGTELLNESYNTLKITLEMITPPQEFSYQGKPEELNNQLVCGDLIENPDSLLADVSYLLDSITVTEESYTTTQNYTMSISMNGSYNVAIGDVVSTFDVCSIQKYGCHDRYNQVEDWQYISATMRLGIRTTSTSTCYNEFSIDLEFRKDGEKITDFEQGTIQVYGKVTVIGAVLAHKPTIYAVQYDSDGKCLDVISSEWSLITDLNILEDTSKVKAFIWLDDEPGKIIEITR